MEIIVTLDDTTREVYGFWLTGTYAVLDRYTKQVKQKGKRKWTTIDNWERLFSRNNNIPEPEIPEKVKYQAEQVLREQCKCLSWEQFKNR